MRASTALKLLPACCGFFLLTPASGAYTFVGCAEDDQGARVMEYGPIPEATMSAEICEGICYAQDPTYTHFGTEYGNECFCTSELGAWTESTACTMDCANTEGELCGGNNALMVYEIDEIDTLTPGSGDDFVYVDCADDTARIMPVGPIEGVPMSAQICRDICFAEDPSYTYFGTQYGQQCFCASELDSWTESLGCTMECANTEGEACGGSYAMSVYQIESTTLVVGDRYSFVDCAEDGPGPRVMPVGPFSETSMSAEVCRDICLDLDPTYTYFGTEYSNECFCADNVGELTVSEACTMPCANNEEEICGGPYALSVYKTDYVSIGCRSDEGGDRIMGDAVESSSGMTADVCYELCFGLDPSFTHFGTQYGVQCYCATDPDLESINKHSDELLPASDYCLIPCAGDVGEACGGSYQMNVYEIYEPVVDVYSSLGCYSDPNDGSRAMEVQLASTTPMSAEICYSLCIAEGASYTYFGTQYSRECWCSTTFSEPTADDSLCTMECADNSPEICGGIYAVSAYSIN